MSRDDFSKNDSVQIQGNFSPSCGRLRTFAGTVGAMAHNKTMNYLLFSIGVGLYRMDLRTEVIDVEDSNVGFTIVDIDFNETGTLALLVGQSGAKGCISVYVDSTRACTVKVASTTAITAYADGGGGVLVDATSAAHGMKIGTVQKITIAGSSVPAYNGVQTVTISDANTFQFGATWSVDGGASTFYFGVFNAVRWIHSIIGYDSGVADHALIGGTSGGVGYLANYDYTNDLLEGYASPTALTITKIETMQTTAGKAIIAGSATGNTIVPFCMFFDIVNGTRIGTISISVGVVINDICPRVGREKETWLFAISPYSSSILVGYGLFDVSSTGGMTAVDSAACYTVETDAFGEMTFYSIANYIRIYDFSLGDGVGKLRYTTPHYIGAAMTIAKISIDFTRVYFVAVDVIFEFKYQISIGIRGSTNEAIAVRFVESAGGTPVGVRLNDGNGGTKQAYVLTDFLTRGRLAASVKYDDPVEVYSGTGLPGQSFRLRYDPIAGHSTDQILEPFLMGVTAGVGRLFEKVADFTGNNLGFKYDVEVAISAYADYSVTRAAVIIDGVSTGTVLVTATGHGLGSARQKRLIRISGSSIAGYNGDWVAVVVDANSFWIRVVPGGDGGASVLYNLGQSRKVTFGDGTDGAQPGLAEKVLEFYTPKHITSRMEPRSFTGLTILGGRTVDDDASEETDIEDAEDITVKLITTEVITQTTALTDGFVADGPNVHFLTSSAEAEQIETTVAANLRRPAVNWSGVHNRLKLYAACTVANFDNVGIGSEDFAMLLLAYRRIYGK